MPGKSKVETPPPSMADVIRNRAYELWGVQPEPPSKPKRASSPKAAKKPVKPKAAAKKR